jgi:hypothetical protein
MRRNILKQLLLAGETVVGTMLQKVSNPSIAQVFKEVGFEWYAERTTACSPYIGLRMRQLSIERVRCVTDLGQSALDAS